MVRGRIWRRRRAVQYRRGDGDARRGAARDRRNRIRLRARAATASKARLIALCDALIQTRTLPRDGRSRVLEPIRARSAAARRARGRADGGNPRRVLHAGARGGRAHDRAATRLRRIRCWPRSRRSARSWRRCARPGSIAADRGRADCARAAVAGERRRSRSRCSITTRQCGSTTRLAGAPEVAGWLRFHTGAPIVAEPDAAAFALIGDPARLPPFDAFNLGNAGISGPFDHGHFAGGELRARRGARC